MARPLKKITFLRLSPGGSEPRKGPEVDRRVYPGDRPACAAAAHGDGGVAEPRVRLRGGGYQGGGRTFVHRVFVHD